MHLNKDNHQQGQYLSVTQVIFFANCGMILYLYFEIINYETDIQPVNPLCSIGG